MLINLIKEKNSNKDQIEDNPLIRLFDRLQTKSEEEKKDSPLSKLMEIITYKYIIKDGPIAVDDEELEYDYDDEFPSLDDDDFYCSDCDEEDYDYNSDSYDELLDISNSTDEILLPDDDGDPGIPCDCENCR